MPAPKNVRPSPSTSAASLSPGTQMYGNDGQMYEVRVFGEKQTHRWAKVSSSKPTFVYSVQTVDNGGTPFLVCLTTTSGKGMAYVHTYQEPSQTTEDSDVDFKLWKKIPYEHAFIGTDPEEPSIDLQKEEQEEKKTGGILSKIAGFFKRSPPWWYGGNSVLLKTSSEDKTHRYIFIGERIYSFSTPAHDKIDSFVSPMGNNAVPYPYAIGQKYSYLMLECIYVAHSTLRDYDTELKDPYNWFYQFYSNMTEEGVKAMQKHQKWQKEYARRHTLPQLKILHDRIW